MMNDDDNDNNNDDNDNVPKADKSSVLNDRQKLILETMITQRTTKQALEYLRQNGFEITERTLRRDKKIIKEKNLRRLYQIAKMDFQDQHIERIEKLKYIERCMWDDVKECQDPYKRTKIKESIANLQPIISAYYDSTRYVLEKQYPNKLSIIS